MHCIRSVCEFYFINLDGKYMTIAIHRALLKIYMKFLIYSIRE